MEPLTPEKRETGNFAQTPEATLKCLEDCILDTQNALLNLEQKMQIAKYSQVETKIQYEVKQ